MYSSAKAKLQDITRSKCKMHATKWELLLILQLNARDVKAISQFLTGEEDPVCVDINSLFMLLTLSHVHLQLNQKLDNIVNFICFEPAVITVDEAKYLFQTCYLLLNRITDLDLINKPFRRGDQDGTNEYGSEAEMGVVEAVFGPVPGQKEAAEQKMLVNQLGLNTDVKNLVTIFETGKASIAAAQRDADDGG
jgi:hypothetical protein